MATAAELTTGLLTGGHLCETHVKNDSVCVQRQMLWGLPNMALWLFSSVATYSMLVNESPPAFIRPVIIIPPCHLLLTKSNTGHSEQPQQQTDAGADDRIAGNGKNQT